MDDSSAEGHRSQYEWACTRALDGGIRRSGGPPSRAPGQRIENSRVALPVSKAEFNARDSGAHGGTFRMRVGRTASVGSFSSRPRQ